MIEFKMIAIIYYFTVSALLIFALFKIMRLTNKIEILNSIIRRNKNHLQMTDEEREEIGRNIMHYERSSCGVFNFIDKNEKTD